VEKVPNKEYACGVCILIDCQIVLSSWLSKPLQCSEDTKEMVGGRGDVEATKTLIGLVLVSTMTRFIRGQR